MFELKIFRSDLFGSIRTQVDKETQEVYSCGRDVAEALGYNKPNDAVRNHCKGCQVFKTPSAGGPQNVIYIIISRN